MLKLPVLALGAALGWLVIATWWPPAVILFWVCLFIAIIQIIVANDPHEGE